MAKACNKELAISDEMIDEGECQRSEIDQMRKTSDEITAAAVSSTTAVSSFTAVSSTTLQDLPIEVLDYILMKAVVKKVMKKLAKCAWISCASRVIESMRTVWSQWNYCLTKRWFELVLSRTLKSKDPTRISVKTICSNRDEVVRFWLAKLGNKIYCLEGATDMYWGPGEGYCLCVYEVQDMMPCPEHIDLPLIDRAEGIVACKQSNTLYVWRGDGRTVWRLIPEGNGGCEMIRMTDYLMTSDFSGISDKICISKVSVLDYGNLLIMRFSYNDEEVNIFTVQTPYGFVFRNIKLVQGKHLSNQCDSS